MRLSVGALLATLLALTVADCSGSRNENGAGGVAGQFNLGGRSGAGGIGGSSGTGGAYGGNGGSAGSKSVGNGGQGGTVAVGGAGVAGQGGASGAGGEGGAALGGAGDGTSDLDPTWAEWPMPNGPLDVAAGAPNPEAYTDNGDQTTTDNVTGLMWQEPGPADSYMWTQAIAYCSTLTLAGYSDWRLPSRIEMVSLLDIQSSIPCIDTTYFPETLPDYFWTSSAPVGAPANVFQIDFAYGSTDYLGAASLSSVRCVRAMTAAAPAAPAAPGRYTYPVSGTVYDTKTRLTWQRTVASPQYDWTGAKAYCAGLGSTLDGARWRLPTIKELQTIVDETRSHPSIDPTAFPGDPGGAPWSSSPVTGEPSQAWIVNFDNGNTGYDDTSSMTYVRCVR